MVWGGMSLRQWYKGQAIKGLLSNPDGLRALVAIPPIESTLADLIAMSADLADAALAEDEQHAEGGTQ